MARIQHTDQVSRPVLIGLVVLALVLLARSIWVWTTRAPGDLLHETAGRVVGDVGLVLVALALLAQQARSRKLLLSASTLALFVAVAYWFL